MNVTNCLRSALDDPGLVQSFSGVRTVFGQGPEISAEHRALACAYGWCYARRTLTPGKAVFLIGRDPRPTGEAVGRELVRGFVAGSAVVDCELRIIDLGIITTPLAETAIRSLEADGGVMVTASHNPLEHNGFKFLTGCGANPPQSPLLKGGSRECSPSEKGGSQECSPSEKGGSVPSSHPGEGESLPFSPPCEGGAGGGRAVTHAPPGALLSASAMGEVISDVAALASGNDAERFDRSIARVTDEVLEAALNGHDHDPPRVRAERAYLDVIGQDWGVTPHCLKPLTLGPALLDPNGGAGSGIDARVLEHFGVRVIEINAELGYPEHGIDTDGIDPASGRHMLLRVARAAARERCHFGVAFDYDADRGNLVLPGHDESAIIPPQKVAAFNVALALARRRLSGSDGNLAVVMSDATSLACERVAAAFGARVFLVETGEINVVTKMHSLRAQGYDVPVGVEGANGGTIFETSTCRDGLQAALSAALAESQPEVAREWVRIASGASHDSLDPSRPLGLEELIASVPTNPNVMLRLSSPPISHGELKRRVEEHFARATWPALSGRFERFEFENFEGTERVPERTGDESGAWRVRLSAPDRRAFVFLRGSRTEAGVWRMIIDADDVSDFQALVPAVREMFDSAALA